MERDKMKRTSPCYHDDCLFGADSRGRPFAQYQTSAGVRYIVEDASEGYCSRGVIGYHAEVRREIDNGILRVVKFMSGKHVSTSTPSRQTLERCREIMFAFTGETA
jgi:pSer/pThr/pTyr-binding forkhead associated (FHA) protein